jgi:hypothetical protein
MKRLRTVTGKSLVPIGGEVAHRRIESVAIGHRVKERAIEDGLKNEPQTDDIHLSDMQRELIGVARGFVDSSTAAAEGNLAGCRNQIQAIMPASLETGVSLATLRRAIGETKDRYRDEIKRAVREALHATRHQRVFEESNGLRPLSPIYGDDKTTFIGMLVLLVLVEALLNASMLQEVQSGGFIGGLMLAFMVSVANVLLGCGCGYLGWRLLIHVRRSLRVLGGLITSLLMTAAFALHLALADLREAIGRGVPDAHIDFRIVARPWDWFQYSGITPYVLFLVGVLAFIIAALKGRGGTWGTVAIYWNHEVYDRRRRAAEQALEDSKADLKAAVHNVIDEQLARLKARHEADIAHLADIRALATEAHDIVRLLGDAIVEEIERLHIWLTRYGDANRTVRTTTPPASFTVMPDFEELRETRLDTSAVNALVEMAERIVAENGARLAALEEKIQQEGLSQIDAMLTLIAASERLGIASVLKDDRATHIYPEKE